MKLATAKQIKDLMKTQIEAYKEGAAYHEEIGAINTAKKMNEKAKALEDFLKFLSYIENN